MYHVDIVPEALDELQEVPVYYRRLIEKVIEDRLSCEPTKVSKNCKVLDPLIAEFAHEPPLWERRVGEWRIFYDVNQDEEAVVIRSIRRKPHGKKTEEIL